MATDPSNYSVNQSGSGNGNDPQLPPGEARTLKSPKEAIRPVKPPKAPKRSRHARNRWVIALNFFFSFAVLAMIAAGGLFYWGSQEYVKPGPLTKATRVVVPKGAGLRSIGDALSRNQVIDSALLFWASVRLQKKEDAFKAGEYLFDQGVSMRDVVEKLVEGKSILYKITLPEGLTSQQIVTLLRENDVLTGEISEIPPEGSLLPNTYTFGRGTSRPQIIERMKTAQDNALKRIWERRVGDLPIKSPEELVILASIVEKETAKADERPRVAGVFINRLRRGMRLQSDPTIIYGIFGGAGKPKDRPILQSDITGATPYNTYVIPALPPTPIANPGLAAMEAVASPSVTNELYFVADGTGGHVFAETLDAHNNNVRRWRQIEAERKATDEKKQEAPVPAKQAPTNQ